MFGLIRKKDLKELLDIFLKDADKVRDHSNDFDFGYNAGMRDTCEHIALALHIDLEENKDGED